MYAMMDAPASFSTRRGTWSLNGPRGLHDVGAVVRRSAQAFGDGEVDRLAGVDEGVGQ